jgi:hypothetical protein
VPEFNAHWLPAFRWRSLTIDIFEREKRQERARNIFELEVASIERPKQTENLRNDAKKRHRGSV